MSNPESRYTRSINDRVKPEIYAWKISDRFTSGVLDCWYSGTGGDLWAEYKWLAQVPKRAPVRPTLSEKQKDWMRERHAEGRNVAVIIGTPDGAVIYPGTSFENPKPASELEFLTRNALANWIISEVS